MLVRLIGIIPRLRFDLAKFAFAKQMPILFFVLTYISGGFFGNAPILGISQNQVQHHLDIMVQDLMDSGLKINVSKSTLFPTQKVMHLGFLLDLEEGRLKICPQKLKMVRKELGKLVTAKEMSCRKMAAILGTTRSFLVALPFLRAFTDTLVQFVNLQQIWGWDHRVVIPRSLKDQLGEIKLLLESWK